MRLAEALKEGFVPEYIHPKTKLGDTIVLHKGFGMPRIFITLLTQEEVNAVSSSTV